MHSLWKSPKKNWKANYVHEIRKCLNCKSTRDNRAGPSIAISLAFSLILSLSLSLTASVHMFRLQHFFHSILFLCSLLCMLFWGSLCLWKWLSRTKVKWYLCYLYGTIMQGEEFGSKSENSLIMLFPFYICRSWKLYSILSKFDHL